MIDGDWTSQFQAPCLNSGQLKCTIYTPEYFSGVRLKLPIWDMGLNGLLPLGLPWFPQEIFLINDLHINSQIKGCFGVLSIKIFNLKITVKYVSCFNFSLMENIIVSNFLFFSAHLHTWSLISERGDRRNRNGEKHGCERETLSGYLLHTHWPGTNHN